MRPLIIVQARMSSSRLPGKILRPVAGKPMLQYQLERLRHAGFGDQVVVATSDGDDDSPVAEFCDRFGARCVRGSLQDVALRFLQVLDRYPAAVFIRLCGDSPLFDPQVIDSALAVAVTGEWDLVTNVAPRTFPPGQSVEAVSASTYREAYREFSEPEDFEHVTKYLYKHPERFRIRNFEAPRPYPGIHLAIDTPEQLAAFEVCLARMDRPHWEYRLDDVVGLYEQGAGA
jgi:spore coat polysaccharide biosynthesis protein SpsF